MSKQGGNQPTPRADMRHASVRMYSTTMLRAAWFANVAVTAGRDPSREIGTQMGTASSRPPAHRFDSPIAPKGEARPRASPRQARNDRSDRSATEAYRRVQ